jgi:hypothetical protein
VRRVNPWIDRAFDAGSASLEFITAGMVLLVPLVYLVVTMAALQAGALAVEGAARQAARVYVSAPDESQAMARADRAVKFSLADYGMSVDQASVRIDCQEKQFGCLTRRSTVTVTVRVVVPLPLVPDLLVLRGASSIPLEASATHTVSRFWGAE